MKTNELSQKNCYNENERTTSSILSSLVKNTFLFGTKNGRAGENGRADEKDQEETVVASLSDHSF